MSGRSAAILRFCAVNAVALGACTCLSAQGTAVSSPSVTERVRQYRIQHDVAIVREFGGLLSIPNVQSDTANIRRNADLLRAMLERRGLRTRLLETDGAPPAVYGELSSPGAARTVAIYAHYDGQPADPALWKSEPWKAVLRDGRLEDGGRDVALESAPSPLPGEWRLFARSVSDDKAPIMALLAALDALRANGIQLSVNLKVLLEGEEEAGSPHLKALFEKQKDLLKADVWLLCDGPVHQTRRMQLYFGARGITDLGLTVYGPAQSLHSGHYGNWAPNPISLLAGLLDSMRDGEGKILIPHFLDDVRPLTASERDALAEIPAVEAQLRQELGLAWNEGGEEPLAKRILYPAVNFRGIRSGHVGDETQNAIPTEAVASLDFRLVPDQTPGRVRSLVEDHIRRQGFHIVSETPSMETRRVHPRIVKLAWGAGYPAARTSMDLPLCKAVVRVVEEATGGSVIKMPSLGGSVPMYLFVERLGTPVIGFPIVNHDNGQHASNENLRLQNLWDGIELFASVLARLGQPAVAQTAGPDVFAFVRALDETASRSLWPGFNPSSLPIALFNGENTLLLRHPSPPPEFSPMPGRPGVLIAPGRYPAVVSNSTRDIAGVRTATVIATPAQSVESTALATVEEVFHVFWLGRHASFRPDESARYAYPVKDVENLRRLLAEDEALARALEAAETGEAARWSAAALAIRRERVPALTKEALAFETSLEMMEGTANYVARRAVGEPSARTAERLRAARPAEGIRWRFYDTGAAVCLLLDRLGPGWQGRVDQEPDLTIEELLGSALRGRGVEPAAFSKSETETFTAKAAAGVAELGDRQQRLRAGLLARGGGRVVVELAEGAEAIRVQRFDPINLMVLDAGEIAHNHFLSLVAPQGTVELTNPGFARNTFGGVVGITVPAGRHPLSDGVRQLTVVGIEGAPKLGRDGETVTLEAPGVRLALRGVETRVDGDLVRITVGRPPPSGGP